MKTEILHLKDHFSFIGKNGEDPVLAVYLPDNLSEMGREDDMRPSLLICPGGGYYACSQREAEPVALHFLAASFNVFILYYSTGSYRYPTQLREVAAAMKLIETNAEKWHCEKGKTAIMGFSAGGHLAANYATGFDRIEVREAVPDSTPPFLSILCYPVISADEKYAHAGSFENLIGHFPLSDGEKEKFSCERSVSEKTPPAFIWHTAADDAVPVMNSLLYAEALSKNKVPFELHVYPFGWHGLSLCDESVNDKVTDDMKRNSAWVTDAISWIK